jgi:predicted nucleotidyltransferase
MIPLPDDFRDFIRLLNRKRVRYVVVGGYAVAWHGFPRYTGGIDFLVELSERNALALIEVFREFGFKKPPAASLFLTPGNIVRVGWQPTRVEVMNRIDGVTFDECWNSRRAAVIGGIRVNLIDLPELLKNKRASGRPKDLEDLRNLPARARRKG